MRTIPQKCPPTSFLNWKSKVRRAQSVFKLLEQKDLSKGSTNKTWLSTWGTFTQIQALVCSVCGFVFYFSPFNRKQFVILATRPFVCYNQLWKNLISTSFRKWGKHQLEIRSFLPWEKLHLDFPFILCWYFTLSSENQRCQDKQPDMFNLLCSLYSSKNALPEKSFCWTLLAQIYAAAHTIDFPQPSLSCLFPLLLGSFLSVSRIPVSLHRQLAVWLRASHLTLVVSLSWGVSEAGWRCPSAFGNKAAEKLAIENNLHWWWGGSP